MGHRVRTITASALVLFLAYGPRAAMPYLLPGYLMATGFDRETFSTLLTVQTLAWGLSALLFGFLADRGHARPVLAGSALVYAAGLALLAIAGTSAVALIGGGVMAGIGLGGTSVAVLFPVLADGCDNPARYRARFAFATAGAALAPLAFIPVVQTLLINFDARIAIAVLALITALIAPLSFTLPKTGRRRLAAAAPLPWLVPAVLLIGALGSGFQTGLVSSTFGVTVADAGLGVATAIIAILMLNLFNGLGTLATAWKKPSPAMALALLFLLRAAAFAAVLALPASVPLALGFATASGFAWLAALPLAAAIVAGFAGTRHLGLITGLILSGWQAGSFIATLFAIETYGWWGHYRRGWEISLCLGLLLALAHAALAHLAAEPRHDQRD